MPHNRNDPYVIYHVGDTEPPLRYQITEADNEAIGDADPIDLSGVSEVRIGVVNDEGLVVNDTANIVTPSEGLVEYEFDEDQIGKVGSYYAEFRVHHTVDDTETFPKTRDLFIRVMPSNFEGASVSGVPEDGNVDILDARVARIEEGLYAPVYADLSNAASQVGNIVYADGSGSDTEGVYRYNGTDFDNFDNATDASVSEDDIEVVNSLSDLNARTGLTVTDLGNGVAGLDLADTITRDIDNTSTDSETVTTAEKPTYDVTSYGAQGDGATDDTASIQSAIDAAVANGGGEVYLPKGTYVISDELAVGSSISITGDGRDASTVETDQSGAGANFPGAMIRGTDVKNFHLEGISFIGPGINAASGTMLYFDRSNNDNVSNITTEGVFGEGFVGNAFAINTPIMSYFRNLRIQKVSGSAFSMFNGGTSVNMDNCYALTCTEAGFELSTITYSTLRGCAAEGCGVGYDFDALRNSSIIGCGAEENFYRSDSHPGIHYRFTNGSHNDLTASYARGFVDNGDKSQLTYVEADSTEVKVERFRGVYSNVAPSDDYRIINGATVDVVDSDFQGPGRTGTPAYERRGGDVAAQSVDAQELSVARWSQPAVFTIFEHSGVVYAMDSGGDLSFSDATGDWGAVADACVQDLPNRTTNGGRIHTTAGGYQQSTQVTIPGTGAFDDEYFPVQFTGEGKNTIIEKADGATLDPAFRIEIPETKSDHCHTWDNIYLEGNKDIDSASAATAIETVRPSGHSGSLREMAIRDAFILRWNDVCCDLSEAAQVVIRDCSIEFTNNSFVMRVPDGRYTNIQIKGGGTDGIIATNKAQITNCISAGSADAGFRVGDDVKMRNCRSYNNGTGIDFRGSGSSFAGVYRNNGNVYSGWGGNLINGLGGSAPGIAGVPAASDWSQGQMVRNVNDQTFWIKNEDGSMDQLAYGFPQDLTTRAGEQNGQILIHDGSGTVIRGLAEWDSTLASGAGNWRSQVDGTTFGPN